MPVTFPLLAAPLGCPPRIAPARRATTAAIIGPRRIPAARRAASIAVTRPPRIAAACRATTVAVARPPRVPAARRTAIAISRAMQVTNRIPTTRPAIASWPAVIDI